MTGQSLRIITTTTIACVCFAAAALVAYIGLSAGSLASVAPAALIALALGLIVWINGRRAAMFREHNYQAYKAKHPSACQGNRIRCHACGNQRIHARALMNRTFMREHFCTQCGLTLYFSPESTV